jgi:RNA polymerase sigma-70 factor (sigma-E family)
MTTTRDEQFHGYVLARRDGLLRTATLLTGGDPHLAEDLVQATLTRLYLAWPAFQKATHPHAYARRALVNALVDEKRRPWRRREDTLAEPPEPEPEPLPPDPDSEALYRALQALPVRMRAVVVFRYFHDLTVVDTADALGCSEGTVKSQTARALDKLREVLDFRVVDQDDPEHARRVARSPATPALGTRT